MTAVRPSASAVASASGMRFASSLRSGLKRSSGTRPLSGSAKTTSQPASRFWTALNQRRRQSVPAITPPHRRHVETLARKGRVAQHTGPLHSLDGPVVGADDSLQSLEQSRVEVMPSRTLRKVLRVAAIASRTGIGMQIPRDPKTLAPFDRPQQPVLHEVTDVPGVAILHGLLYAWRSSAAQAERSGNAEHRSTHEHGSQGRLMW